MKQRQFSGGVAVIALAAILTGAGPSARADGQADTSFAKRMFATNAGKTKSYACFVRHYDAEHMAQHPLQKVSVMKLLITAEKVTDDPSLNYSFRLGVNFRNRPGDFDSSGDCGHAPTVRAENGGDDNTALAGIDFFCGVDCDGGGISVDLNKDNASVIVKLDRIRIWKGKDPDESASTALKGGADDKVFRTRSNKRERLLGPGRRPEGIGRDAAQVKATT